MKIKKLLAVLENLNPDFDLTIWANGERYSLDGIDTSFFEQGFIELTAHMDKREMAYRNAVLNISTQHEATK
jgi:hypothetical protein